MKLYVAGALAATVSLSGQIPYEDSASVTIGGPGPPSNMFVDDVRIYDYALSQSQV